MNLRFFQTVSVLCHRGSLVFARVHSTGAVAPEIIPTSNGDSIRMSRLAKNTIATGLATLLVTTGMAFAANGADGDRFVAHAEAQFISAGDEALGAFLETVADQIEGVEVTCEAATPADECTKTQASDALASLPAAGTTGITVGAANNYASGDSGEGSSVAASGAVTDSGTINTGAPGGFPSDLNVDLDADELSPVTDGVANPQLSSGAIASSVKLSAPDAAPEYDYSIAGMTLNLELPALKALLDQVETEYGGALDDVDAITLADVCAALPQPSTTCDALPLTPDPLTVTFPSLSDLFSGVADSTDDGIDIDLAAGTVQVDLVQVLGKEINQANFPADADGTDLIPLVADQIDTAIGNVVAALTDNVDGIVPQILTNSSIEVALPEVIPGTPVPPIVLDATQLSTVLQPIIDDLASGLATVTGGLAGATPDLSAGLADLLELRVGVTGLADESLVGDDSTTLGTGVTYSVTALQLKLLQAQAADLRLATSLVGPNSEIAVDSTTGGTAATAGTTDGETTDGAAATTDGSTTGAIADADSAADADASTTLPDAGAGNLLPFFLLGLALLAFGLGVLLNERRRLGGIDSGLTA